MHTWSLFVAKTVEFRSLICSVSLHILLVELTVINFPVAKIFKKRVLQRLLESFN